MKDLLANFCGLVFNSTVPSEVSLSHTSVLSRNISINIVSLELLKEYYNSCICYSLIFDETENNGVVKLGLKARFSLEDGKFVQPTISLCTFYEKCKSFNLTKWLLSTLKKKCLNLDKCIGLCTDGAKVMKGKIKGVSKLLHDIIKKKRNATNSVLKINEDITCLAHKENLCLKEFCKNDYMKLQLKFVHWLTQNCIIRQWNVYAKKNSLNRLPVPSIIRWGYMYDVIKFIFMNYRHVFIFSKAIVGKHSFNNFIKDDTSLQNNSIDDIKKTGIQIGFYCFV